MLHHAGGIYADADVWCVRPMARLLRPADTLVVTWEGAWSSAEETAATLFERQAQVGLPRESAAGGGPCFLLAADYPGNTIRAFHCEVLSGLMFAAKRIRLDFHYAAALKNVFRIHRPTPKLASQSQPLQRSTKHAHPLCVLHLLCSSMWAHMLHSALIRSDYTRLRRHTRATCSH